MTTKELKELIALIPDDFEIGYKIGETIYDNWSDPRYTEYFNEILFEPNIDIKNKRVTMFTVNGGHIK